ncbi:MAG: CHAT domain-containing tetratricopeptide repeat protein [Candidatus Zixiibacteriota bacterium]
MRLRITLIMAVVIYLTYCVPAMSEPWEIFYDMADSMATVRDFDSACTLATLALREIEETYGADDTLVADVICRLGLYQLSRHNYKSAESLFVKSLEITKKHFGEMHSDVARAYHCLGSMYDELGYADRAIAYQSKSLEICEKIFPPDDLYIAKVLHNLALTSMNKGLLEKAEVLYTRALKIIEKNLGSENPETAVCIRNLAVLYEKRGMMAGAEALHLKVLKIREDAYGRNDPLTASAILNLANCYKMMGRLEEAEKYYLEAIEIWERTVGPDDLYVAKGLTSLSGLYIYQKKFDKAESMLRRALDINRKVLGTDHPIVSDNLKILGDLLAQIQKFDEAETLLLQAYEINKNTYGSEHSYALYILKQLGYFYVRCGRLDLADSLLNLGLKTAQDNYASNYMLLVSYYGTLGRLYAFRHDSLKTFDFARRETEMRLSVLYDEIITMSERDALAYSRYARLSLDALLSCYLDYTGWDDEADRKALDLIQFTKGLITDGIFERQRSTLMRSDPETARMLDSLRLMKYQLSNLFTAGSDKINQSYKRNIDSIESSIKNLEQTLSMRSADIRKWKKNKQLDMNRVISSLEETDVFVDYYKFNYTHFLPDTSVPHYLAVVVSKRKPARIIDLGEAAEIDDYIRLYRDHMNHIAALGGVTIESDMAEYSRISRYFYQRLWQPLEDSFVGAGRVIISPDDALNLISFAGLSGDESEYLIEKYTVHYLSSGRDLIRLEERSKSGSGLLAVGDPDFNAAASNIISAGYRPDGKKEEPVQTTAANIRSACGNFEEIRLSPLPETRKEIEMIAETWKKYSDEPVEICLGNAASEDYFKSRAPGNRVIHLATHGYFFDGECHLRNAGNGNNPDAFYVGENPLLLTGLFLAGANKRPESSDSAGLEDGILTACEVSVLDLSGVDLVVLSACETGLGQLQEGEGVFGLRRAFQMAGARTVISTLWPIADKSAMEIFSGLYSRNDLSLAERVRRVQLDKIDELRKQARNDHPYNWGGLVIFGDWK